MVLAAALLLFADQTAPVPVRLDLGRLHADYPASALRAEQEGTVGFELEIDETGRVTACRITRSSGFSSLDANTCRVTYRRKFRPALDASGKPVPAVGSATAVYTLGDAQ